MRINAITYSRKPREISEKPFVIVSSPELKWADFSPLIFPFSPNFLFNALYDMMLIRQAKKMRVHTTKSRGRDEKLALWAVWREKSPQCGQRFALPNLSRNSSSKFPSNFSRSSTIMVHNTSISFFHFCISTFH